MPFFDLTKFVDERLKLRLHRDVISTINKFLGPEELSAGVLEENLSSLSYPWLPNNIYVRASDKIDGLFVFKHGGNWRSPPIFGAGNRTGGIRHWTSRME